MDADSGHRAVRLSRLPGRSESFYFHQNAFAASSDKMVFVNYELEPKVNFTPDSKWVEFRGNFDGDAQVYGVEVAPGKPPAETEH